MKIVDSQLSVVVLGALMPAGDVGLFRVAGQGAVLITFGQTAINLVLAPHVARLYADNELKKLQRLVKMTTLLAFSIALPVALIFMIWGRLLIGFVFGDEYVGASSALVILCLGQLFNVAAGSVTVILNMAGFEKESVKAVAAAFLSNITLTLLLVPKLGIVGAAWGTTMSFVIWNGLMMRSVYKKVGIRTFVSLK